MEGNSERSVFVSHVQEDAAVASWLQGQVSDDFLGGIEVFVSSEREGAAGEDWLTAITEALQRCRVLVALCSPISIHRPWVNFELGAAWALGRTIIPACHAGLTPEDLKSPFSSLRGVVLGDANGMKSLYTTLAGELGFGRVPPQNFAKLAAEVPFVETAGPAREGNSLELQMVDRDRDIRRRMRDALEGEFKLRRIDRVAAAAAVSEETAKDILRADESVCFKRNPDGDLLVGLKARNR